MFPRSFRARLTSFFIVIVILPMLMVTVALLNLVADSEQGKTDAGLDRAQRVAVRLANDRLATAVQTARAIGGSQELSDALQRGDRARIESALKLQITTNHAAYALLGTDGQRYSVGDDRVIAPATTTLVSTGGKPGGRLTVAAETTAQFAADVKRLTGVDVAITGDSRATAVTLPGTTNLPTKGDHKQGNRDFRVSSFTADGASGPLLVHLLANAETTNSRTASHRREIIIVLAVFLVIALVFAFLVSRALQAQVQRLLTAARRLGKGDFAVQVPTDGNDEFAALGTEFNSMARQLESRLDELEAERVRLQHAIRRVGESLATGLDRDALMQIVVQTAVDGVAGATGRAMVRDAPGGPLEQLANVGYIDGYSAVLDDAEATVLATRDAAQVSQGDRHAMSHPLWPSEGGTSKVIGIVSVARDGRPFTEADSDLFHYLASQAAVSIENADLHETVQRQAVTDELTGLFNHRRFQEVMAAEVERSRRYGDQLGLIMLDIDDFKRVNDTYGHLQGDQVLREVAKVLLETSREIDEPARYGGEEMAVALPRTDLDGATLFAERLRGRIENLEIPILDGTGTVKITASVGAAALAPPALIDKDTLVRAADAALYRAKRLGKNRVVKAG